MSGDVLAVTSGKGGVGKSTTALNLGVSLGTSAGSVVLVDADLGMANIGGMLDIHTTPTLHDVLAGEADVESAIVAYHEAVDVVPGGHDLAEYAEADPDRLPAVLATLAEQYKYVVVDAGAGLGYADVVPVEAADEVILTTTSTDAAIGDTAKLAKFSERVDAEVRGVVVTHADETTDAEVVATKVGTQPLAVIPEDPNVQESIEAGLPLEQYAPESPAGIAYRRLAGVISGQADAYTGDAVQYPEDAGEQDTTSVPDPLEDTGERDSGTVPDPFEDSGERDVGGTSASPAETDPITGAVEASLEASNTSGPDDLPEIGETQDQDDALESHSDSTVSVADDDSNGETSGGLLARLRNLL